ncbi:hypothetical protein ACKWTF_000253 [Chironomus riparius]
MSEALIAGFTAVLDDISKCNKSQVSDHKNTESDDVEQSINEICPDKYEFRWKEYPKLLDKDDLKKLIIAEYKKSKSYDILVQIDEKKFECQLLILKCYSDFFAKRSKDEKVIELNGTAINPNAFYSIYRWMISTSKKIERDGLIPLLIGAEYLQVSQLVEQCWNLIQNVNWFQEDQAYLLYKEARTWKYEKIQSMMMKQVKKIFLTVIATHDFVKMDKDEVKQWLQLENIGINSEVEIFYAAARWLLHDWNERQKYLMELMMQVRFGLFPSWRIVILRKNENTGKLQELLKNQELQKYLEDSMSYSIYRSCFEATDYPRFADFLCRFGYQQLFEREVIYDSYWQKWYKKSLYTFEDFLNYLKYIKSNAFIHSTQIQSNKN